jgi:rhodanese-related sulfurtransferase
VKRVDPEEAQRLVRDEGYAYVDVRSVMEFDDGHPEGAYNVPLLDNPDFVAVMEGLFAKDAKLVLGCKAGGRSLRAAGMLAGVGFTELIDQKAGYHGQSDPFGRTVEQGWLAKGLPTSKTAAPGRSYAELKKKAGR